jgi:hypothetical protein
LPRNIETQRTRVGTFPAPVVEALAAVIGGISGAGPAPRLVYHPGAAGPDQKAPRKAADPNAVPEKRAMLWHTAERRKVRY